MAAAGNCFVAYIARAFYIGIAARHELLGRAVWISPLSGRSVSYIKQDKSLCRRLSGIGRMSILYIYAFCVCMFVEKAIRSLLLFNPSSKLNGGPGRQYNESAANIAIELYLCTK